MSIKTLTKVTKNLYIYVYINEGGIINEFKNNIKGKKCKQLLDTY